MIGAGVERPQINAVYNLLHAKARRRVHKGHRHTKTIRLMATSFVLRPEAVLNSQWKWYRLAIEQDTLGHALSSEI